MKITREKLIELRDRACALHADLLAMLQEDRAGINPMVISNVDLAQSRNSDLSIHIQDAIEHFEMTLEEAAAWQAKHGQKPFRYAWEIPPEEQTLQEFVATMEVALCAHSQPAVETEDVSGWMNQLRKKIRPEDGD